MATPPAPPVFNPDVANKTPKIVIWGFVFSILGWASFGLLGVVGVVMSAVGLKQTRVSGKGKGLAIAAIIIGGLSLLSIGNLFRSADTPTPAPQPVASPAVAAPSPSPSIALGDAVVAVLTKAGFDCSTQGVVGRQCVKGKYNDPVYGESHREVINIYDATDTTPENIDGFATPKTFKLLEPLGLYRYGDVVNGSVNVSSSDPNK